MKFIFHCLVLISIFIFSSVLEAHTRSQSFSHWDTDDTSLINFTFAVDARRVTQLSQLYEATDDLAELLTQHLQETIQVQKNNMACELKRLDISKQYQSILRAHGQFQCPQTPEEQNIKAIITAFQVISPTHIHIARIESSELITEQVIREGRASINLLIDESGSDFAGFTATGFWHVLSGLDHLVFLVALLLVAGTARNIIICVTGFTLGHSLSLALATLGWITPEMVLVEALIGFTIAFTALEAGIKMGLNRVHAMYALTVITLLIILPSLLTGRIVMSLGICLVFYSLANSKFTQDQAHKWLPTITIAFGLIHGAGFASGLKEALLFQTKIFMPLLGFNIGVELAQLFALAIFFGLYWVLKTLRNDKLEILKHSAAVMIFGLGCFWFAERLWV